MRSKFVMLALLTALIACCTSDIAGEAMERYAKIQDMSGEAVIVSGGENTTIFFAFKKPSSFIISSSDVIIVSNGSVEWVYYANGSWVKKAPERPIFDYGDILSFASSTRKEGEYYVIDSDKGSVWLDGNFLPVKIVRDEMTVEFRRISVNTGMGDDYFTFTPPSGEEKAESEKLLSIEEASKRVNFSIIVPAYTAKHEFSGALVFKFEESEVVNLYYGHGDDVLIIVESQTQMPFSNAENVTIETTSGNVSAQIVELGESTMLRMSINGVDVIISGKLSRDEIVKIAESMLE